jgi:quercetin dioxygenase-like cupin family protein
MHLRRLDRANLTRAHGLDGELLLPWPALNAPFKGGWFVLRAGDESTPHSHPEYEFFIAMLGRAAFVADGVRREFVAGDIVHLRPGVYHQVVNDNDDDFEYYAIWWDTATSAEFTARHCEDGFDD